MTIRFPLAVSASFVVGCVGLLIGCSQPDQPAAGGGSSEASSGEQAEEFDPHDVKITEDDVERPADFKDAVARIKKYRDDIETNAGGDTPGLAHRPLDELDISLRRLPQIAVDGKMPQDQCVTINVAANELRELFEKVHLNIDNKVDPDFASVKEQIDAKIAELETIAQTEDDEGAPSE
jgi:hypothetical protein